MHYFWPAVAVVCALFLVFGKSRKTQETAECQYCHYVDLKTNMVKNQYGWFCDQEELEKYWWRLQI